MAKNVEIFIIITAVVIALVRVILSFMEEKDRAKGMVVNPKEYKMSFIVKQILKDDWNDFKNFIKKVGSKLVRKRNQE